ncbi:MAG: hypothetical protein GXO25_04535, partial [Euryarchaeota archaeon]|nr:hypothetical protein [Euryarchaeota archaeon]
MRDILNCISDHALFLRALKTMPFGILLAWAWLSFIMLGIYFTWRGIQGIGWPPQSAKWLWQLLKVGLKVGGILLLMRMALAITVENTALRLPPSGRGEWRCADLLINADAVNPMFAGWKWEEVTDVVEADPASNWESLWFCRAYLLPPGAEEVEQKKEEVYVFMMQSANLTTPRYVWHEWGEQYQKSVNADWVKSFVSPYACAWRWVEDHRGSIIYYGIYDEFVIFIRFKGNITGHPEAMLSFLRAQDEKLGKWIKETR